MVRKLAFWALFVLLLAGTALAIHDAAYGGYTGQTARERRIDDPFSRQQYFGENYYRPFSNFGSKGPTERILYTGSKSAYSASFNLDTNSFSNRGRNPGTISNYDPRIRGFSRVDRAIKLLPFSPVSQEFGGIPFTGRGTARLISVGQAYGATLNKAEPRSQFWIQLRNLPPPGESQIYEVWLYDKESEYSLTFGLLKSNLELTASKFFEIKRDTAPFDSVIVTLEPFPDYDPSPSEIVLIGDIQPTRRSFAQQEYYVEPLR